MDELTLKIFIFIPVVKKRVKMDNLAYKKTTKKQYATINSLYRVQETIQSLKGAESLSRLARSWLSFFVELAKMDYIGIRAQLDIINHAQWLATGYTRSKRSAFRALAELEKNGYIKRRRKFRDQKISYIDFNLESFTYWLQRAENNVIPFQGTFSTYIDLQVTDCHTDNVMSNNIVSKIDPCSISSKKSNKVDKTKTSFKDWMNPVLYSLKVVLFSLAIPNFSKLYAIAEQDKNQGGDLIDWQKYTSKYWQDLPKNQREQIIESEILPVLKMKIDETQRPTNQVYNLCATLAEKIEVKPFKPLAIAEYKQKKEPSKSIEVSLSDSELKLLKQATENMRK